MDTCTSLVVTNLIYFLCGLYLLYINKNIYGVGFIIIGLISTIYHKYEYDHLLLLDRVIAAGGVIFVLLTKYKNICIYRFISLMILFSVFIFSNICWNINKINIYNISHSIWHILSAIVILILIIN